MFELLSTFIKHENNHYKHNKNADIKKEIQEHIGKEQTGKMRESKAEIKRRDKRERVAGKGKTDKKE